MRSIYRNAFRRHAAERRRGGATLEEEGKCEAFIGMPSDDMPPSEGEGAVH